MIAKFRWLALAGFFASLAAGAVACGETTTVTTHELCWNVACGDNQNCDPTDGHCKCGGTECAEGEICNSAETCVSPRCDFHPCDNGHTCDPVDGQCKCGDAPCQPGQACVDGTCVTGDLCANQVCGFGLACDPADGACKCAGVGCNPGEICLDGQCAVDRCAGVNCTRNSICSREDGACHCMGSTGPICNQGEACIAETMTCVATGKCDGVVCGEGTACDPADGKCYCHGAPGTRPQACEADQTCVDGKCLGGDLCRNVDCDANQMCDPSLGVCRCGDAREGDVCVANQTCMELDKWRCASECRLLRTPSDCGRNESCVIDTDVPGAKAFCAPKGTKRHDQACISVYDCVDGATCMFSGEDFMCKLLCFTGNDTCAEALGSGYFCGTRPGVHLPSGMGVCSK